MIDLRSYTALEHGLLVKWEVPNFATAYISDCNNTITFDGHTYTNIGKLLAVSNTVSELTSSPGDLTISLSGIPTNSISDILSQEIKGSTVTIYRSFWDPATHDAVDVDSGVSGTQNIIMSFTGIVTNYSISDTVDVNAQLAVSTIVLTCNSIVEVLSNKTNGRKTNSADFPNELSMSRVQSLANSNFNFGAP